MPFRSGPSSSSSWGSSSSSSSSTPSEELQLSNEAAYAISLSQSTPPDLSSSPFSDEQQQVEPTLRDTLDGRQKVDGSVTDRKGKAPERLKEMDHQMMVTYFIAGGLAGAASRTVVSPLERLKIILQVQPKQSKAATKAAGGREYHGVWSSLGRMYREEGLAGFMKGNGVNCARIIPYSAVQFTTYEALKSWMRTYTGDDKLSTPMRLLAGGIAGTCSVVSTYPLDLVRARLSIATATIALRGKASPAGAGAAAATTADVLGDKDLGIWGMTKRVYRTEGGIKGLYRGMTATAIGVAPYVSLNFFFYESLKSYFIPDPQHASTADIDVGLRTLLCGAVSGTVSQTMTYPFDVLRRKMQVAGLNELSPKYNGAWDAMVKITKAEGWFGGMYRGIWPNLLKVAPSIATSFYVYENVKDLIADGFAQRDARLKAATG